MTSDEQFDREVERLVKLGYERPLGERTAAVALAGHGDVIQIDDAGNIRGFAEEGQPTWSDVPPTKEDKDVRPPEPPRF